MTYRPAMVIIVLDVVERNQNSSILPVAVDVGKSRNARRVLQAKSPILPPKDTVADAPQYIFSSEKNT